MLFLGLLAALIGNDYPYVGEWFDAKGEGSEKPAPLEEQRSAAVHNLWMAVIVYGVLGVVSGVSCSSDCNLKEYHV